MSFLWRVHLLEVMRDVPSRNCVGLKLTESRDKKLSLRLYYLRLFNVVWNLREVATFSRRWTNLGWSSGDRMRGFSTSCWLEWGPDLFDALAIWLDKLWNRQGLGDQSLVLFLSLKRFLPFQKDPASLRLIFSGWFAFLSFIIFRSNDKVQTLTRL